MALRAWRKRVGRARRRLTRAVTFVAVLVLTGPVAVLLVWPVFAVYRITHDGHRALWAELAYLATPALIYLFMRLAGVFLRWCGDRRALHRQDRELRRYLAVSGLSEIDEMEGHIFERFVAARMVSAGWQVTMTSAGSDYGVDLIATNLHESVAVQCKRYAKTVGIKAVQEVVAGAMHYGCARTMVVSNQDFTRQARSLAAASHCELVGRDRLPRWLRQSEDGMSYRGAGVHNPAP